MCSGCRPKCVINRVSILVEASLRLRAPLARSRLIPLPVLRVQRILRKPLVLLRLPTDAALPRLRLLRRDGLGRLPPRGLPGVVFGVQLLRLGKIRRPPVPASRMLKPLRNRRRDNPGLFRTPSASAIKKPRCRSIVVSYSVLQRGGRRSRALLGFRYVITRTERLRQACHSPAFLLPIARKHAARGDTKFPPQSLSVCLLCRLYHSYSRL